MQILQNPRAHFRAPTTLQKNSGNEGRQVEELQSPHLPGAQGSSGKWKSKRSKLSNLSKVSKLTKLTVLEYSQKQNWDLDLLRLYWATPHEGSPYNMRHILHCVMIKG